MAGQIAAGVAIAVGSVVAEQVIERAIDKALEKETYLRIENKTGSNIISTQVTETDSFDWCGPGPEGNFQNKKIPVNDYWEEREDVNSLASNCPFTMLLRFADGTKDKFRINQKFAIDAAEPGFSHKEGKRNITYRRIEGNKLIITIK